MFDLVTSRRVSAGWTTALLLCGGVCCGSARLAAQPLFQPPAGKASLASPPLPAEDVLTTIYGVPPADSVQTAAADPPTDPPPPAPICSLAQCDPSACPLGPNRACLLQTFQDLQWRICVYSSQYGTSTAQGSKGLEVGPVYLRRLWVANDPWKLILYRASLAEIVTAYHSGIYYYDTQYLDWSNWRRTVTAADAGPNGTLVTLSQDATFGPSVVAECRDRGPGWLCKQTLGSFVRRGQELALWGILDTGNYDFITEYGFRDDGSITMRVGATGYNNPTIPSEAHMHDALWRIDMDLDGSAGDSALSVQHFEPLIFDFAKAIDVENPFNLGVEGSATWTADEFTSLLVTDAALNATGEHPGYELEPLRSGNARHYGFNEQWTQRDFWVTRWHGGEDPSWATPWKNPNQYLSPYVNGESVVDEDLVLWYFVSGHHHPTDEDRDGLGDWGVTLTHWFGLELRPHNFFERNPLGGPARCGP